MKSWTEKKSSSLPIVFILYPECQQSQLALGVGFSIGSKTDGTKVCPETCLWNTVANKEVQMAELKGLLKEKSTFKGKNGVKCQLGELRYQLLSTRTRKNSGVMAGTGQIILQNRSVLREKITQFSKHQLKNFFFFCWSHKKLQESSFFCSV